ncbi:MAG: hypothetical protein MJE66_04120 [Proteobacteria bacterium]|nr:hypothetical protein [Pseudomonadota bacterium]
MAAFVATGGCATGALLERARITETAVAVDSAHRCGDEVWLEYRVRVHDARARERGDRRRRARLAVAELQSRDRPVDDYRVRPLRLGRPLPPGATAVPVRSGATPPEVELALGQEGEPASLHLGTLRRTRTAGWAYVLLPLAGAWDAVTVPLLAVSATPFFVVDP